MRRAPPGAACASIVFFLKQILFYKNNSTTNHKPRPLPPRCPSPAPPPPPPPSIATGRPPTADRRPPTADRHVNVLAKRFEFQGSRFCLLLCRKVCRQTLPVGFAQAERARWRWHSWTRRSPRRPPIMTKPSSSQNARLRWGLVMTSVWLFKPRSQ